MAKPTSELIADVNKSFTALSNRVQLLQDESIKNFNLVQGELTDSKNTMEHLIEQMDALIPDVFIVGLLNG